MQPCHWVAMYKNTGRHTLLKLAQDTNKTTIFFCDYCALLKGVIMLKEVMKSTSSIFLYFGMFIP
jgi:hypothetical protein